MDLVPKVISKYPSQPLVLEVRTEWYLFPPLLGLGPNRARHQSRFPTFTSCRRQRAAQAMTIAPRWQTLWRQHGPFGGTLAGIFGPRIWHGWRTPFQAKATQVPMPPMVLHIVSSGFCQYKCTHCCTHRNIHQLCDKGTHKCTHTSINVHIARMEARYKEWVWLWVWLWP